MGTGYSTIPADGYTCLIAAEHNDTLVASCYDKGTCLSTGACSCNYFLDPLSYCNQSYYQTTPGYVSVTYAAFSMTIISLYLLLYISELIIDIRRLRSAVFKKTGPIAKIAVISHGILTIVSVALFTEGYINDSTTNSLTSYTFNIVAIAILLGFAVLCSIRWFEMMLRAENVNTAPRHLIRARIVLIIILCIVLPLIILCALITRIPGASANLQTAAVWIGLFLEVVGFGIPLFTTTVFLFKSLRWLGQVVKMSDSVKLARLHRKSWMLVAANIVLIGNNLWTLIGGLLLPLGSDNATTRNLYVTIVLEIIVVMLLFGFLESYWRFGNGEGNPFQIWWVSYSEGSTTPSSAKRGSSVESGKKKSGDQSAASSSSTQIV